MHARITDNTLILLYSLLIFNKTDFNLKIIASYTLAHVLHRLHSYSRVTLILCSILYTYYDYKIIIMIIYKIAIAKENYELYCLLTTLTYVYRQDMC